MVPETVVPPTKPWGYQKEKFVYHSFMQKGGKDKEMGRGLMGGGKEVVRKERVGMVNR